MNRFFSPPVEWSAKLNIRVMEPDSNSENVAAVSQSSVGSDCKYRSYFTLIVNFLFNVFNII